MRAGPSAKLAEQPADEPKTFAIDKLKASRAAVAVQVKFLSLD